MITTDGVFRILALCTSSPGRATVSDLLRGEIHALDSWDSLLDDAEANGLEPLLRAHLREASIPVPPKAAEYLTARWMQHAHAHAVRTRVIADVLTLMEDERIPLVLLKGAALAHLVYRRSTASAHAGRGCAGAWSRRRTCGGSPHHVRICGGGTARPPWAPSFEGDVEDGR